MAQNDIQNALDRTLVEALKPLSLMLAVLFAIFACFHPILLPGQSGIKMCALATGSFVLLFSMYLTMKLRPLPTQLAHPCASVICLLVLTNIFVHGLLVGDAKHLASLMLLIVACGLVFVSLSWLLAMIAITVLVWIVLAAYAGWSGNEANLTLQLTTAIALSLVGFLIHVRAYRRLEIARIELAELSLTDALTGLRNRRAFRELSEQLLKSAQRDNAAFVLFYIDLDNMKPINDNLGHAMGDCALIETAKILKNSLRQSDLIARLGGDEFCVLCAGDQKDSDQVLCRLNENLSKRNELDTRFQLQFSIGIVFYDAKLHTSIDDLLKSADEKMFEQKRKRKGGVSRS